MNAARQIIAEASRQGAVFRLADGKLRLVPPPGKQPAADLVARAKAHREEIIAAITETAGTNSRSITRARDDGITRVAKLATLRSITRARARDDRSESPAIDICAHLANAQSEAERRNRLAAGRGLTDRYCRCGALARLAWPDSAGRPVWRCDDCAPTRGRA